MTAQKFMLFISATAMTLTMFATVETSAGFKERTEILNTGRYEMVEGIAVMIYSLALSLGTMVLCYTEPLRATEKSLLIVSGLIIGWFWTREIIKQSRKRRRK